MCKYVSKPQSLPAGESPGRWWGKLRPEFIPFVKAERLVVTEEQYYLLCRAFRKWNEKKLYKSMVKTVRKVRGRARKRKIRKKYRKIGRMTGRFLVDPSTEVLRLYECISGDSVPF